MKETSKRRRQRLVMITSILARILLVVGILVVCTVGYYQARNAEKKDSYFALKVIDYSGADRFNTEAFNTLLESSIPRNLLAVDLERVRSLVESEVWVKGAMVRRKLPDRLLIPIEERTPAAVAAIDGGLYVVDEQGIVLDSYGPSYKSLDQPIVKGLNSVERENAREENAERLGLYLAVIRDLSSEELDYTQSISEVDVGNPDRVAVIPSEEPVAIYLGQQGFRKRYETFLSQKRLYYQLKEKYGLIEYVDVTYDDKIIFHTPNESVSG